MKTSNFFQNEITWNHFIISRILLYVVQNVISGKSTQLFQWIQRKWSNQNPLDKKKIEKPSKYIFFLCLCVHDVCTCVYAFSNLCEERCVNNTHPRVCLYMWMTRFDMWNLFWPLSASPIEAESLSEPSACQFVFYS